MFCSKSVLNRVFSTRCQNALQLSCKVVFKRGRVVNCTEPNKTVGLALQNELQKFQDEHQSIVQKYRGVKKKEIPVEVKNQIQILKRKRQLVKKRLQRREEHFDMMREVETACVGLSEEQKQQYIEEARLQRIQQYKQQEQRLHGVLNGTIEAARVVVECSFIQDCSEREMKSLAKQIQRGMGYNKKSNFPVNLSLTSFEGRLQEWSIKLGSSSWSCHQYRDSVVELFPADELIIMSPDAEEVLETVESNKVYVIGGLVDRTVQRNITQQFGQRNGIKTRRLPVNELIQDESQQEREKQGFHSQHDILTINQVIEALIDFQEFQNWQQVLQKIVPTRKRRRYTQI